METAGLKRRNDAGKGKPIGLRVGLVALSALAMTLAATWIVGAERVDAPPADSRGGDMGADCNNGCYYWQYNCYGGYYCYYSREYDPTCPWAQ